MKKLLFIPAMLAMLAVSCGSSGGGGGGGGEPLTEWGDEVEAEMISFLGEVLPFVGLNKNSFNHGVDTDLYGDDYYFLEDDNKKDLMTGYAASLVSDYGWKKNSEDGYVWYTKGNLELYASYYEATAQYKAGNLISVYNNGSGGGGGGGGGEVSGNSAVFEELELEGEGAVAYTSFEFDDFDLYIGDGSNANDGKYYVDTKNHVGAIRIYTGFEVLAAEGVTITKIEFEFVYGNSKTVYPTASDCDVGTYNVSTQTWTGSADDIVFTFPSTSGNWAMASISVTVA